MTAENLDLKQFYSEYLVKVGISPYRAEEAARNLSGEQLRLISEICPVSAAAFPFLQAETLLALKT